MPDSFLVEYRSSGERYGVSCVVSVSFVRTFRMTFAEQVAARCQLYLAHAYERRLRRRVSDLHVIFPFRPLSSRGRSVLERTLIKVIQEKHEARIAI